MCTALSNSITSFIAAVFLIGSWVGILPVSAQLSRKPSAMKAVAASAAGVESKNSSLDKIANREDFDSIARVFHPNTPYALPHAMFVIDRRAKNKIYFVNSQRFRFHKDFLLASYLVPRGADVFKAIYIDADRRFVVGTIAWPSTGFCKAILAKIRNTSP
ncbi:MAG: hypothetical protein LC734_03065 [Acidobacteria bacterium]|nr:hypothetical protein [Acidobacteriota bacterium]